MKEVTFDVETTIFEKGNPFSRRNRLCYGGVLVDGVHELFDIEYSGTPYGKALATLDGCVSEAEVLIGFNIKFDLHWLRRYSGRRHTGRVWDCQLADFILYGQAEPYPSLDGTLARYGLPLKLDVVRTEYWDRGIDTPDVPRDTLEEYLRHDLDSTYAVYLKQKEEFENGDPRRFALFRAQCVDLLALQDAEFQGLLYDTERSLKLAETAEADLVRIDGELCRVVGSDIPINWNSGDHLSAILYGGTIYNRERVSTERTLKSGEVKHGEKWGEVPYEFRGMARPLPRSETKPTNQWDDRTLQGINNERIREGKRPIGRVYSTDEPSLKSLRPASKRAQQFIGLVLERAKQEKLLSTYWKGIPSLIEKKDWNDKTLHGQFNQCVAATGRLTCTAPNLQNFASETKDLFYSRFPA